MAFQFTHENLKRFQENVSTVQVFYFHGFIIPHKLQVFMFITTGLIYVFILLANAMIALLVCLCTQLQHPLYIFLGNFSFTEICYTSVIIPQTLIHFVTVKKAISYTGCLLQLYFCSAFGCTECLLLSTMAYDRYLAICYPLHYSSIMRSSVCINLALLCWAAGFLGSLLPLLMVSKLLFCGPNEINHFFCDSLTLFTLSCTDTSISKMSVFFFASAIVLGSSLLILLSYTFIMGTILNMSSAVAKQKAFSTCASHLMVVSLFYGTLIFTYVASPAMDNNEVNKGLSLIYTVVTPMLNPVIYTLRNSDIHRCMDLKLTKVKLFLNDNVIYFIDSLIFAEK